MKFKYVGPLDEVSVDAIGVTVKKGGVVDVPEWVAGRAPVEHTNEDGTPKILPNGKPSRDLGEGLLAQPDVWQPVATAKKKES